MTTLLMMDWRAHGKSVAECLPLAILIALFTALAAEEPKT